VDFYIVTSNGNIIYHHIWDDADYFFHFATHGNGFGTKSELIKHADSWVNWFFSDDCYSRIDSLPFNKKDLIDTSIINEINTKNYFFSYFHPGIELRKIITYLSERRKILLVEIAPTLLRGGIISVELVGDKIQRFDHDKLLNDKIQHFKDNNNEIVYRIINFHTTQKKKGSFEHYKFFGKKQYFIEYLKEHDTTECEIIYGGEIAE
jgi:hypothetical protein